MFKFFRKSAENKGASANAGSQSNTEDFNNIEPLALYFKLETGITFEKQQSILKSKLISFCKIHHIYSFEKCLEQVKADLKLKQKLINYLTTNESFFFRELHQIQDLVHKVKLSKNPVNILCAPCSGLIELDTLIRDNKNQLLRCQNGTKTNIQTVF